jgi:manganese efflux pump family protein
LELDVSFLIFHRATKGTTRMTGGLMLRLILFALPLSLDNFAASTVLGVTPLPARARWRLALTFAAAEGLMPAVGLLLGLPLGAAIGEASPYVAGAVMAGVGLWLWWQSRDDDEDDEGARIARAAKQTGWAVLGIALGISLDELAIGFSFGVLRLPLAPALVVLAAQALLVSIVGQWVGGRVGASIGERAERLAGPALCILGVYFILAQALGWLL